MVLDVREVRNCGGFKILPGDPKIMQRGKG